MDNYVEEGTEVRVSDAAVEYILKEWGDTPMILHSCLPDILGVDIKDIEECINGMTWDSSLGMEYRKKEGHILSLKACAALIALIKVRLLGRGIAKDFEDEKSNIMGLLCLTVSDFDENIVKRRGIRKDGIVIVSIKMKGEQSSRSDAGCRLQN